MVINQQSSQSWLIGLGRQDCKSSRISNYALHRSNLISVTLSAPAKAQNISLGTTKARQKLSGVTTASAKNKLNLATSTPKCSTHSWTALNQLLKWLRWRTAAIYLRQRTVSNSLLVAPTIFQPSYGLEKMAGIWRRKAPWKLSLALNSMGDKCSTTFDSVSLLLSKVRQIVLSIQQETDNGLLTCRQLLVNTKKTASNNTASKLIAQANTLLRANPTISLASSSASLSHR